MKYYNYIKDSKRSTEEVFVLRNQILDKRSLKKPRVIYFGNKEDAADFLDTLIEKANLNNGRVSLFYTECELHRLLGYGETAMAVIPYICSWFGWEKDDLKNGAIIKRGPDGYGCEVRLPKLRVYSEALDDGMEIKYTNKPQ